MEEETSSPSRSTTRRYSSKFRLRLWREADVAISKPSFDGVVESIEQKSGELTKALARAEAGQGDPRVQRRGRGGAADGAARQGLGQRDAEGHAAMGRPAGLANNAGLDDPGPACARPRCASTCNATPSGTGFFVAPEQSSPASTSSDTRCSPRAAGPRRRSGSSTPRTASTRSTSQGSGRRSGSTSHSSSCATLRNTAACCSNTTSSTRSDRLVRSRETWAAGRRHSRSRARCRSAGSS